MPLWLLAILWALAAAFLVDWSFELSKPARLLSLLVCVGAVVWIARRFTLPYLGHQETDLDMVLMVERQQKIDSDLVAALQFESAEAPQWGSTQLEACGDRLRGRVRQGLERFRRLFPAGAGPPRAALTATVRALGAGCGLASGARGGLLESLSARLGTLSRRARRLMRSWSTANRLCRPGGRFRRQDGLRPTAAVRSATSGELPSGGRVDLSTVASGLQSTVDLARRKDANPSDNQAAFQGQLPKLVDSLFFQVYLGDAWTDPIELRVIPLPVVDLRLTPTPPAYAVGAADPDACRPVPGRFRSSRARRLASSWPAPTSAWPKRQVLVDGKSYPLTDSGKGSGPGRNWSLATAGTPLEHVEKPTRFEVQVVDEDGMHLESPIQGFIRIKADQRPRISADVVTRFVLPSGTPVIDYRANDDFGIGKLLVHLQSMRGDSAATDDRTLELVRLGEPLLATNYP